MNKRYQVFVSSTYVDLVEERAEVMQALLELDCMPAGMELFPAASEEQWNWIKKVIDESDYYIVILGGRYGSVSETTGFSYTEMEYRYAIERNIPAIAFLHEDITKIESGKTEQSQNAKKKLDQFRALTQKRLCKYWSNPTDLGAKVSRSVTQLIKHNPAPGWIRANELPAIESQELNRLRQQVHDLETTLAGERRSAPVAAAHLSQGDDRFDIEYSFETKVPFVNSIGATNYRKGPEGDGTITVSWNELFKYLSPKLIEPESAYSVVDTINKFILSRARHHIEKRYPKHRIDSVKIYSGSFDLIKIQLKALDLISISEDHWTLTQFGNSHMYDLLTLKRATSEKAPTKRKKTA